MAAGGADELRSGAYFDDFFQLLFSFCVECKTSCIIVRLCDTVYTVLQYSLMTFCICSKEGKKRKQLPGQDED